MPQIRHFEGELQAETNNPCTLRVVRADIAVLTPEKTIVSFTVAGIALRVVSHLIDVVLVFALVLGIGTGVAYVFGGALPNLAQGLMLVAAFLIPLLYFILLEGLWNGQTLGKKICSLRVRMADGTPVTFAAAMGRNLLRPADMLPLVPIPYFMGLIAVFLNGRNQRLGDLVAGTVVCIERRTAPTFHAAPHAVGIHPLEERVGDLRGMTREEYTALRRYADRFPELAPAIQERLTREIFLPIAQRRNVETPPDIHPIYLAEAMVMKYGRQQGIL